MASWVVVVGDVYIESFSYPESPAVKDKKWLASEGIHFAPGVKAILGKMPFLWDCKDSASYVGKMCVDAGAKLVRLGMRE